MFANLLRLISFSHFIQPTYSYIEQVGTIYLNVFVFVFDKTWRMHLHGIKYQCAQQNRRIGGSSSYYNFFSINTTACVTNYVFMSGATCSISYCYAIDLSLMILFWKRGLLYYNSQVKNCKTIKVPYFGFQYKYHRINAISTMLKMLALRRKWRRCQRFSRVSTFL